MVGTEYVITKAGWFFRFTASFSTSSEQPTDIFCCEITVDGFKMNAAGKTSFAVGYLLCICGSGEKNHF